MKTLNKEQYTQWLEGLDRNELRDEAEERFGFYEQTAFYTYDALLVLMKVAVKYESDTTYVV